MKTAFVFPGQGAQKVGMGRDVFEASSAAREVFERANRALGEPLSQLIFEGPADALMLTANTQPAILTVSTALLAALREKTAHTPAFVAGHSLGEFSALVAASAFDFEDAVRTTRARGRFMQEAVPAGQGAMAAVVGKTADEVAAICREASAAEIVAPANFNAPTQIVISGAAAAVGRASARLIEQGAKVIPLQVSAPFHCAMMAPAAKALDDVLASLVFHKPTPAVVTNVEAQPNTDSTRIRELLYRQVTAPVRWTETVQYMIAQGVSLFIEFGPGNVLAGLIKRIHAETTCISVNSTAGLDKALATLGAN